MSDTEHHDAIIIGAGLAGLTCGIQLAKAQKRFVVLEATDRVGGRVRTDIVDGFKLDHGFQVLLTSYPACKQFLDYDALRLRNFEPGALVRVNQKFRVLSDPWRRPSQAIATVLNPVATFGDEIRIAKLRSKSLRGSLDEVFQRPATDTLEYLRQFGFSRGFIEQFFRPFIGGVFLDSSLSVSSRMLEFIFRMFSKGEIAIPADGMAAIPRQLAERLPRGSLRLKSTVASVSGNRVELTNGTSMTADSVVIATESTAAARLTGIESLQTNWNRACTFYYGASRPPDRRKLLMLCGDENGPIQSATVLSNVAPEYAPDGRALISVSLGASDDTGTDAGDLETTDAAVRDQLRGWFGDDVTTWQRLGVYHVPYGVPRQSLDPVKLPVRASDFGGPPQLLVCGDHRETPSIQGAMNSGVRASEAILEQATSAQK